MMTEYFSESSLDIPSSEWIKREIKIIHETLYIISYDKDLKDIQRWTILGVDKGYNNNLKQTIYFTNLASAQHDPVSAIFIVSENIDNKVEIIDCKLQLQNTTPAVIRVHID